ncbi:MAG TPA: putative Ig domain-containing protein [Holophaga sp.]|nr:putative Ig domain-containing protein [Holophaga sp.]
MFLRLTRRGAGTAMFLAGTALCMTIVGLQTGCSTSNAGYANPTPAISAFTGVVIQDGAYKAADLRIPVGGSATLRASYGVKDGTAVVTPGNIQVVSNKPFTIYSITQTTTYTLTVTAGDGTKSTSTCTVTVLPPPTNLTYDKPSPTFYKDVKIATNAATVGGGGTYTYSVAPALPPGLSLNTSTGAITGTPTAVTPAATYVVTAVDDVKQQTTANLTIGVEDTPLSFKLTPSAIAPGGGSILSWNANSVAGVFSSVNIQASPVDASLPATFGLSGSANVSPAVTTTYTITATPATGGAPVVRNAGLTVGNAPVAITSFAAAPPQTTIGGSTTLSWALTGVPLSLTLNGQDVLGLDSQSVVPVRRQAFTLTGANALNTAAATSTISVAARGFDTFVGAPITGGNIDGKGAAASFLFATSLNTSTTNVSGNLGIDPDGNVLVVDWYLHTLRTIAPDGTVKTIAGRVNQSGPSNTAWAANYASAGTGLSTLWYRPTHMIAGDSSTYYAVGGTDQTLRKLVKQGDGTWTVSVLAGTPALYSTTDASKFDNPTSVALYNGKLYVTSSYDGNIRVHDLAGAAGNLATFAGAASYGFADGTGAAAKFRTPSSIAVDPATGDFFVCDRENHAIRKVTQAGVVTTIAGGAPAVSGSSSAAVSGFTDGVGNASRFFRPAGIVRAADGSLFVTDYANHAIRKLTLSGGQWTVTTVAGTGTAGYAEGTGTSIQFNGPEGITMDAAGNLYVQDTLNNIVRKLVPSSGSYTSAPFAGAKQVGLVDGNGTDARFTGPNGVAFDNQGNLWVADELNKAVRKVTPAGDVTTISTGSITLTAPYSISVDAARNVYVLDRQASAVQVVKISNTGTASVLALTGFTNSNAPRSLAVTADGNDLFLADNTTLRKFSLTTLAQTASLTGLSSCQGLAVAGDGVYWAEFSGHTIKKAPLDLSAASVVAGVLASRGFLDGAVATARFNAPVGLALTTDISGAAAVIYVADQSNYAIRKIDLASGQVTTLVGGADTSVTSTGVATLLGCRPGTLAGTASVYYPKGIAINAAGDLAVSTSNGIMQVTAP